VFIGSLCGFLGINLSQYALNFVKKTYIVFYEHKFLGRAVLLALPRKAVAFLTHLSVCRSYGEESLTSAAFLKNCCTKKLSIFTAKN
jgi:hypothetical protein